jgi:hypothetical protein
VTVSALVGLLVFFALPLLLRATLTQGARLVEWRAAIDVPLGVGLAAGVTLVNSHLAGRYLYGAPFTASDFSEYCEIVDAVIAGRPPVSGQRSLLVAWMLAPFVARFGVIDGFAIVATGSIFVLAGGLYLWGHAVAGRTAAVTSVTFLLACAPVAMFGRTLTFYPAIVAATALCSGATAMALRTRRAGWIVLGAIVSAAAPLFDVRNVSWTLACAPLVALAALLSPGRRVWALAVPICLWASWEAGTVAVPDALTGSLEQKAVTLVNDVRRLAGVSPPLAPCPGKGFTWGHSDPLAFGDTLRCLHTLNAGMPSAEQRKYDGGPRWDRSAAPWMPIVGIAAVFAAAGLVARRPFGALALIGPIVPFAVTLLTAWDDPNWRRVGAALVPAPLLLGVAWALLLEAGPGTLLGAVLTRSAPSPIPTAGRRAVRTSLAAVACATAVLLGVPYTPLAPSAPARAPYDADAEWVTLTDGTFRRRNLEIACGARIAADQARGVPAIGVSGRWFWGDTPVVATPFPDQGNPTPVVPNPAFQAPPVPDGGLPAPGESAVPVP